MSIVIGRVQGIDVPDELALCILSASLFSNDCMVGILRFPLPEYQDEFKVAQDGGKWAGVVRDMDNQLREWLKYGHKFKTADEALGAAREYLREEVSDKGLELEC